MPDPTTSALQRCDGLSRRGLFEEAEQLLRGTIQADPGAAPLFLRYAQLQREADRRDDSAAILDHLLRLRPDAVQAAHLRAVVEMERGRDARGLFTDLLARLPADAAVRLGAAEAHWSRGDAAGALAVLKQGLEAEPEWVEGARSAARILAQSRESRDASSLFDRLHRLRPRSLPLWLTHAGFLGSALAWAEMLEVIWRARAAVGRHQLLDMMEAQALSELGEEAAAEALFGQLEPIEDGAFAAIRMRALLRTGRPEAAAQLGERFMSSAGAAYVWPLLSLAWCAVGDPRREWLDRSGDVVQGYDLGLDAATLTSVVTRLRDLHAVASPPYDQSAREGTQTHGNLFDRTDPEIVALRAAVVQAIRRYVDGLPPPEPGHPLLGTPRERFRFAGSWSIRLHRRGHHVPHNHPAGWISSALHLVVPASANGEEGCFISGGAPPELGLDCPPYKAIPPVAGRLLLFPSILWHGTAPFGEGERLTVAFDVAPFPS